MGERQFESRYPPLLQHLHATGIRPSISSPTDAAVPRSSCSDLSIIIDSADRSVPMKTPASTARTKRLSIHTSAQLYRAVGGRSADVSAAASAGVHAPAAARDAMPSSVISGAVPGDQQA